MPFVPTKYISWFETTDPHPAALKNLNAIVAAMLENSATNAETSITVYQIAKSIGRDIKQMRNLLRNRPGFVLVHDPGSPYTKYYWDRATFNSRYPEKFTDYRGRQIVSEVTYTRPDISPPTLSDSNTMGAQEVKKQLAQAYSSPQTESLGQGDMSMLVHFKKTTRTSLSTNDIVEQLRTAAELIETRKLTLDNVISGLVSWIYAVRHEEVELK